MGRMTDDCLPKQMLFGELALQPLVLFGTVQIF